ncbi:MAG: hypothetical protein E6H03_05730 [Bacillati bacterium ANGP1]|uniref:Acetamidase n=1 Tax=Candidatus Segetimicrobium genomatis TaxID=2569760 RepID=A0A537JFK9_9BACT|nr:MAG: hypothetical protein E6H03_05730 [Terrabacteria group bacterium ANGP1]
MQRIVREQARKYAFDRDDEPLLRVRRGERFEIETYDASTGYFETADQKAVPARRPGFDRTPPLVNPIAGPVWVEGVERGDTLVVTIEGSPPAGLSCPASTRQGSFATPPVPAEPPATGSCTSMSGSRGPSPRLSARLAWRRTGK